MNTYLVDSFVAFRDVCDEQPKIVWKLKVDRVAEVGDERVRADRQQLKLLSLLRFVVRVDIEHPPDPRNLE